MVFISYSRDECEIVLRLHHMLTEDDIECWIDYDQIAGGTSYIERIPKSIKNCSTFLLILSEKSQNSMWIPKELSIAISYKKRIIPFHIDHSVITDEFEFSLADVQIIEAADNFQMAYKKLITELKSEARIFTIPISKNPFREFYMIMGDFQDNAQYVIEKKMIDLATTVFAMGIDSTGRLDLSSKAGILRYFCIFLEKRYEISLTELQRLVDAAKASQFGYTEPDKSLSYGDILCVKVLIRDEQYLNLLLIVNSRKQHGFDKQHDLDMVEGPDSREIIIKIFNKCRNMGIVASTLFIGAMGTNGLLFPYEVVTAEIINAYVYAIRQCITPYNVFFSVRKEDMNRCGVTSDKIAKYIRQALDFF